MDGFSNILLITEESQDDMQCTLTVLGEEKSSRRGTWPWRRWQRWATAAGPPSASAAHHPALSAEAGEASSELKSPLRLMNSPWPRWPLRPSNSSSWPWTCRRVRKNSAFGQVLGDSALAVKSIFMSADVVQRQPKKRSTYWIYPCLNLKHFS